METDSQLSSSVWTLYWFSNNWFITAIVFKEFNPGGICSSFQVVNKYFITGLIFGTNKYYIYNYKNVCYVYAMLCNGFSFVLKNFSLEKIIWKKLLYMLH